MISNLKNNEINLVVGGKRCLVESVYAYSNEFAKTLGVLYCLLNSDTNFLGKTDEIANKLSSKTLGKAGVKKMLCSTLVLGIAEVTDYLVGDWFECD